MKFLRKALLLLFNKYIAATLVFLLWIGIFDRNDLLFHHELKTQLKQLKNDKKYYSDEIERNKQALEKLSNDSKALEKFAREKYLMKKDNEEIFVIVKQKKDSIK